MLNVFWVHGKETRFREAAMCSRWIYPGSGVQCANASGAGKSRQ
jgi:hypothetical protein